MALEAELADAATIAPIVHTGVGKVNAAIHLYEAILQYQPELVINYGTAGALNGHSGLLKVDTIVQHDIDARGIGFERGTTPFSDQGLPKAKGIVLGSGDHFVTDPQRDLEGLGITVDLVDMEGFALQAVCQHTGVAFDCYKYMSDGGDTEAGADWKDNVAKGSAAFTELVLREYGRSGLL